MRNFKIQKKIGATWQDEQIVINHIVAVPAQGLIKLDSLFNPENVVINEPGIYRLRADFLGKLRKSS